MRAGRGRPSEHRAGVAVQDDEAPPFDPIQGKIHLPTVNEPVLMGSIRFIRMGLWRRLGAFFAQAESSIPDVAVGEVVK